MFLLQTYTSTELGTPEQGSEVPTVSVHSSANYPQPPIGSPAWDTHCWANTGDLTLPHYMPTTGPHFCEITKKSQMLL